MSWEKAGLPEATSFISSERMESPRLLSPTIRGDAQRAPSATNEAETEPALSAPVHDLTRGFAPRRRGLSRRDNCTSRPHAGFVGNGNPLARETTPRLVRSERRGR